MDRMKAKIIKTVLVVSIVIGLLVCMVMLPFRSMLVEAITATSAPVEDVREGDVIFQTSLSSQSPMIKMGTCSSVTHCGIVVMIDGKPYVLETLKTLVITPIEKFIARGKNGKYWLKRSDNEYIKIKYNHYLGKAYDLAFRLDNDVYYCSELVYDIYLNQLDIELCNPKTVDDYLLIGIDRISMIRNAMNERGITMEQYAIAPKDIFQSKKLKLVKQE